jgi:hypothetical protein
MTDFPQIFGHAHGRYSFYYGCKTQNVIIKHFTHIIYSTKNCIPSNTRATKHMKYKCGAQDAIPVQKYNWQ